MAQDGLPGPAAAAAGIDLAMALQATDPAAETYDAAFAASWVQAVESAADRLEQAAWRRAVDGVAEPVIRGGQQVGETVKYSDALLVRLLQARRPGRFGSGRKAETDASIQITLTGDDVDL